MNLFEIIIEPKSAFSSELKGDTIFGQFCWQLIEDPTLSRFSLSELLRDYSSSPFAIFSSAIIVKTMGTSTGKFYVLPKPTLPTSLLCRSLEDVSKRKDFKRKKYFVYSEQEKEIDLNSIEYLNDEEVFNFLFDGAEKSTNQKVKSILINDEFQHNSISRLVNSTGSTEFAPFEQSGFYYFSNETREQSVQLSIFCLVDLARLDPEVVFKGLERIGQFGFGKDASTGKGRFKVLSCEASKLSLVSGDSSAAYTLSPFVPGDSNQHNIYFVPFVRYGKHGSILARGSNPYKKPIIMANEGAVIGAKSGKLAGGHHYVGRALQDVSFQQKEAVSQGYAICIPLVGLGEK